MSDKDRKREVRKRAAAVKKANEEQLEHSAQHFRDELRKFCAAHGGQNEAAPLLGTNQPTISRWLHAKVPTHPKLWMMVALSRATGRSIDDLLGLARADGAATLPVVQQMAELLRLSEQRRDAAEAALKRQSSHVREKARA